MARLRSWVTLLGLCGLLVGSGPIGQAMAATGADDVVRALRSDPVFVQDGSGVPLDADLVRDTIASGSSRVYVAALPARAWQAQTGSSPDAKRETLLDLIGETLGPRASLVLVFGDRSFRAGSGSEAGVRAGDVLEEVLATTGEIPFDEANVTAVLVDVVQQLQAAEPAGSTGGSSAGGGAPVGLLAVLGVAVVGGGGVLLVRSRRQRLRGLEEARADVESLYDRLGSDVSLLSPGDDPVARQALADASERYTATGALMSKADTPGEFAAARRTAIEGLTAARVVRERLGLDLGPALPPPPASGPLLTERGSVQVEGQDYEGSPTYEPGRAHFFGGGRIGTATVPGGWYAVPFWESLLVGGITGAVLGGLDRHDRYDRGYDDAGRDRDEPRDWSGGGSSGGGTWGSGDGGSGGGSDGGSGRGGSW